MRQYHEIAGVGEIARRYFVINAFDGSLTTLGVLAGSYAGGVDKAGTVISLILSTAVSIGVAGFYGSYQVERAERDRALREIEESTLSSLQDTTLVLGLALRHRPGGARRRPLAAASPRCSS